MTWEMGDNQFIGVVLLAGMVTFFYPSFEQMSYFTTLWILFSITICYFNHIHPRNTPNSHTEAPQSPKTHITIKEVTKNGNT